MFNAIRNWFNKPRISLRERWNVATLLSLLEELPAEKYNHSFFGFDRFSDTGCALGLAMANRNKFIGDSDSPSYHFVHEMFGSGAWASVFDNMSGAFGIRDCDVTKKMVIDRLKAYAYDGYRNPKPVANADLM